MKIYIELGYVVSLRSECYGGSIEEDSDKEGQSMRRAVNCQSDLWKMMKLIMFQVFSFNDVILFLWTYQC